MQRRHLLATASAALLAPWAKPSLGQTDARGRHFAERARALEAASGGRLGILLRDTTSGRQWAWRQAERFPMASTFKLLLGAQALAAVDAGQATLDERLVFAREELVAHSPVTESRTGPPGMAIGALCHATITISDNMAANVLLARFGGPAAFTAWCRATGDLVTRLDRTEPALNEALPGDERDTTTPAAMAAAIERLVLGDALRPASRAILRDWLLANTTGGTRLRAQLPPGWRVGDKTGSGARGTHNDVGLLYPPGGGAPWIACAYCTGSTGTAAAHGAIAGTGALAAELATMAG